MKPVFCHKRKDEFPTTAMSGRLNRYAMWTASENVEEALWKCADMTGQRVEISKVKNDIPHTANILWLRFAPMRDDEVTEYLALKNDLSRKTMFAHMDGDFHGNDNATTPHGYCKALYAMKDSDVGVVCMEVINDLIDYSRFDEPYAPRTVSGVRRMEYIRHLSEHRDEVYPAQIAYAHENGMKLFAGHRMQLSGFAFPLEQPMFTVPFVDEHPELRCMARDGRAVDFLSYGYEAVQDFMIGNILESARYGFDGVHLIFDRGQHLLFEAPVRARAMSSMVRLDFIVILQFLCGRILDKKVEKLCANLRNNNFTRNGQECQYQKTEIRQLFGYCFT